MEDDGPKFFNYMCSMSTLHLVSTEMLNEDLCNSQAPPPDPVENIKQYSIPGVQEETNALVSTNGCSRDTDLH